jgi:hypothetical protein
VRPSKLRERSFVFSFSTDRAGTPCIVSFNAIVPGMGPDELDEGLLAPAACADIADQR